jgi:cell wall-associated NlpC family hydrolase
LSLSVRAHHAWHSNHSASLTCAHARVIPHQAAYAQISIQIPRIASAQPNWLAAGNGIRIRPGRERPGDLVFWDSYLGPNQLRHVIIVWNPATKTTIEAHNTRAGVGHFNYANGPNHHIFEIWRVGNIDPER